jgi:DNA-binding LacI/PurR family transcriptional regulator
MTRRRVSSSDVARLAKVSQSAVSRTFSPDASVSEDMRRRVLSAAKQLGYQPNAIARAMISGRSKLIAVLFAYLDNHFYPQILEQMSRRFQEHGYQVLLFMTGPGDQDSVVQKMRQYQVEGIVMASATLSSTLARECASGGTPVVMFNRYDPASPTSSVTSDNVDGGRQVARFLVAGGHSRIAFIAGHEDSSTSRDREAGFLEELVAGGLRLFSREVGGFAFDRAADVTRRMFAGTRRPDAVFVANDHMAFSVMDVLRDELHLRIPEDVSVVGYDDVPEASWGGYRLTTVAQPAAAMLDATVSLLLEQIETRSIDRHAALLPARLVVRGSARLPRRLP